MRISDRHRIRIAAVTLLVAMVSTGAGRSGSGDSSWTHAAEGYTWSFPEDHWSHPDYRIEWWYFTGHLQSVDRPDREFGYQFTLFRVGLRAGEARRDSVWEADSMIMGHASVTDKTNGTHRFSELLYRTSPLLAGFSRYPEPEIAWSRGPAGTRDRWFVRWNGDAFDFRMADATRGFSFELQTRPLKPRIFQGPGGLSRKTREQDAGSLYYSFTRLETSGRLTLGEETWSVQGQSWMDKEFSTSHLGPEQAGWDWFSLQLEDGRELMLYAMRHNDGTVDYACGSIIDAAGGVRYLGSEDWTGRTLETWGSPESGITYPAQWRVSVPSESLDLVVTPAVADQENRSRLLERLTYWEGAVDVSGPEGTRVGRGYVELTGYGENTRPPI